MSNFSRGDGTSFNALNDIDLKWSYSEGAILIPAVENLEMLTSQQRVMWDLFYPSGAEIKPILRSEINPSKMLALLPDIWLYDLILDQQGTLLEIKSRLQGTRIDEFYGSGQHDHFVLTDFEDKLSLKKEDEVVRTIKLALMLCETEMPLFGHVKQLSDDLSHLSEHNLVFPVCHNSDHINMMIGHTEVLPVSL